jgi:hypothetical protein
MPHHDLWAQAVAESELKWQWSGQGSGESGNLMLAVPWFAKPSASGPLMFMERRLVGSEKSVELKQ